MLKQHIQLPAVLRYLIVWRVNHAMVKMPTDFATELSFVLGTLIADRLPTNERKPWRKALAVWEEKIPIEPFEKKIGPFPEEVRWPIEAVVLPYPFKRLYGQGEPIIWELKLLGPAANSGFFLEMILPAMEEASTTTNGHWKQNYNLWGRFDITAVYVAQNGEWQPLVRDGRLDLSRPVSPNQWQLETLVTPPKQNPNFHRLIWQTPFQFFDISPPSPRQQGLKPADSPSLLTILNSLVERVQLLMPGKNNSSQQTMPFWGLDEQTLAEAATPPKDIQLNSVSGFRPGHWQGSQYFKTISPALFPYLELASIVHVGQQTHLGCGTFRLQKNKL